MSKQLQCAEDVTPANPTIANLTEVKTSHAVVNEVATEATKVVEAVEVNEGKTTLPATPIATNGSKKPKKKKKKKKN